MSDLCRREGIKPHSYYSWTKEFMEAGGSFAGGHLQLVPASGAEPDL